MKYNYQQIFDGILKQVSTEQILRLPDGANIPNNPDNTDWQQYQAWLAEGNQPLPPEGDE